MPTRPISFKAHTEPRPSGGITIALPFDPDREWSAKDRHYVAGTIGGYRMRGVLSLADGRWVISLGPSWCRDPRVGPRSDVEVVLGPEGPQLETIAPDLAAALTANPQARRLFESLATFYRNGFVDWVEDAKRPETRDRRIEDTVLALRAGRRQH